MKQPRLPEHARLYMVVLMWKWLLCVIRVCLSLSRVNIPITPSVKGFNIFVEKYVTVRRNRFQLYKVYIYIYQ